MIDVEVRRMSPAFSCAGEETAQDEFCQRQQDSSLRRWNQHATRTCLPTTVQCKTKTLSTTTIKLETATALSTPSPPTSLPSSLHFLLPPTTRRAARPTPSHAIISWQRTQATTSPNTSTLYPPVAGVAGRKYPPAPSRAAKPDVEGTNTANTLASTEKDY